MEKTFSHERKKTCEMNLPSSEKLAVGNMFNVTPGESDNHRVSVISAFITVMTFGSTAEENYLFSE